MDGDVREWIILALPTISAGSSSGRAQDFSVSSRTPNLRSLLIPILLRTVRQVVACLRSTESRPDLFSLSWVTLLVADMSIRRAHDGIKEDVYYKGEVDGQRIVYSDQLFMALLKGRRREIYGDRVEHAGAAGTPIQYVVVTGVPQPDHSELA